MAENTTTNFRMERIEKLLHELRYEVTRGIHQREIGEEMTYEFIIPMSQAIPNGVVFCEFRTRPIPHYEMHPDHLEARLRIVK